MLGALPQLVVDIGSLAVVVSAVIGALFAVSRFSDVVGKIMWGGFEKAVGRATDDIREDVGETKHLVNYHLGPNGKTTPIHERLKKLEAAHAIEDDDRP